MEKKIIVTKSQLKRLVEKSKNSITKSDDTKQATISALKNAESAIARYANTLEGKEKNNIVHNVLHVVSGALEYLM